MDVFHKNGLHGDASTKRGTITDLDVPYQIESAANPKIQNGCQFSRWPTYRFASNGVFVIRIVCMVMQALSLV